MVRLAVRVLVLGAALLLVAPLWADTVLVAGAEGRRPTRTVGEILDWTGERLTVRHPSGREEAIDAARIVGVEDTWNEPYLAGLDAFQQGDYASALEQFQAAIRQEKRTWARREIVASCTWCYWYQNQVERAIASFLAVHQSDPTSRHFAAIPLSWTAVTPSPSLQSYGERLLADASPVARLIGASWLLTTPRRSDAIRVLQTLLTDSDARVVFLAEAQLWRTRPMADATELARWRARVDAMPEPLRAGPYLVLGTALGRSRQHEAASLDLLRIPILYPRHRELAAQALLAAAGELTKINQLEQARGLYRELIVDHPESAVAGEARRRLSELDDHRAQPAVKQPAENPDPARP